MLCDVGSTTVRGTPPPVQRPCLLSRVLRFLHALAGVGLLFVPRDIVRDKRWSVGEAALLALTKNPLVQREMIKAHETQNAAFSSSFGCKPTKLSEEMDAEYAASRGKKSSRKGHIRILTAHYNTRNMKKIALEVIALFEDTPHQPRGGNFDAYVTWAQGIKTKFLTITGLGEGYKARQCCRSVTKRHAPQCDFKLAALIETGIEPDFSKHLDKFVEEYPDITASDLVNQISRSGAGDGYEITVWDLGWALCQGYALVNASGDLTVERKRFLKKEQREYSRRYGMPASLGKYSEWLKKAVKEGI